MSIAMRTRPALVVLISAAAACGPTPRGDQVVVRDSAGIQIVESREPIWRAGESWSVDSATITIGAADGKPGQELHQVNGAVRLSDGSLIVANGGSAQLYRYDPNGRFLGAIGRAGDGPGEFQAVNWVGRIAGDTLVVWDRGLDRVSLFAPSGEYVREVRPVLSENPMALEVKGALADGRLLMARGASFIPAGATAGTQRQPITGWLIDRSGREVRSFGPFPGEAVHLQEGADGKSMSRTPIPFGASTIFASGRDAIYIADSDAFAVRVYSADGTLIRIVRGPHPHLPVLAEDVHAYVEARVEDAPPIQWIRDGIRASFAKVQPPDSLPAVRSIELDQDDQMWIELARHESAAESRWDVFTREGALLGEVTLPGALQVFEIGRDYIIGRDRDDLGVERVRVLKLRK
jgi:hypothetical protein